MIQGTMILFVAQGQINPHTLRPNIISPFLSVVKGSGIGVWTEFGQGDMGCSLCSAPGVKMGFWKRFPATRKHKQEEMVTFIPVGHSHA